MSGSANYSLALTYDAAGQIKTLGPPSGGPGVAGSYTFDNAGQLTQYGQRSPDGKQVFANTTYTYDKLGNVLTVVEADDQLHPTMC